MLRLLIHNAHITMLSKIEERETAFLQRCNGKVLGTATDLDLDEQLAAIVDEIYAYK
jgi:hypothetical protein